MLTATLVPACAVVLLLIVSAVIAIVYVRKRRRRQRRSVIFKSMDEVEMKSTNQTEAGLVIVDRYVYNLYNKHFLANFIHRSLHHLPLAILTPHQSSYRPEQL